MSKLKIEKAPGYDWDVDYLDENDTKQTMSVFGKLTAEDALREAKQSLEFNFFDLPDHAAGVIVGLCRVDHCKEETP